MIPSTPPSATPRRTLPLTSTPRRGPKALESIAYRSYTGKATQSIPTPLRLRPPRRGKLYYDTLHSLEAHPEPGVSGDVHRIDENHEVNELSNNGDRNISSNGHGNEKEVHNSNLKTKVRTFLTHQLSKVKNDDISSSHQRGFVPVNEDAIEVTPNKENNDQWFANFNIDSSLLRVADQQFGPVFKAQNNAPDETLTATQVWPENAKAEKNLFLQISTAVTPRAFNKVTGLSPLSMPPIRRTSFRNHSTPSESRIPRAPSTPCSQSKDENLQIKSKPTSLIDKSKLVRNISDSAPTQIPCLPCGNYNQGNIRFRENSLPISQFEHLSSLKVAESTETQISPVLHHRDENLSINLERDFTISQSEAFSSPRALESGQTRIPRLLRKSDENARIESGSGSPTNQPESISSRSVLDSPQTRTSRTSQGSRFSAGSPVLVETTSITQEIGSSKAQQRQRGLFREARNLESDLSNPDEIAGSEFLLKSVLSSRRQCSTLRTEKVTSPVHRSMRLPRRKAPNINSPALF